MNRSLLMTVLAMMLPMLASAAPVTMVAVDAGSTSSLISAGQWSNAAAPSPANDYFSSTFFIRTPIGATNFTFAGNSLTLQAPSTASQGAPIRSILFKGAAGQTMIINNLTNSGGVINAGSGNVLGIFGGNQMFVAAPSTIMADQGPFQINYPLAGSADLTNTSGQGRTITYTGTNSAFTGRFVITANVIVGFNSVSNVPGNPATPTPSQFLIDGTSTLLDNAGITYNNPNGGITLSASGATINASATNALGQTVPTTIATPITDNGGGFVLVKRGLSILTLAANNTFSGGLQLLTLTAGSQLNINNANALGTGPFTIMGGAVGPALLDNSSGAPITVAGNNAINFSNNFVFLGSSSLNLGAGAVTLGTNVTVTVSNNNLTLGPVGNGGLGYTFTKSGPGTLTLAGGGSFANNTTVSNGVLALGATLASTNINLATGTATLDVTALGGLTLASGQTLAGSGTVAGALTSGSGTTLSPGGNNVTGTLTVNGNLNLSGGGTFNYDLTGVTTPGGGVNDLIIVSGALNASGVTTLSIGGSPVNGTYTLIQYGSFSGTVANFSAPLGFTVTNNTGLNAIQLIKTHVPANLTWKGDGSANTWDVGTTANFLQGATSQVFLTGDSPTFDNTGSASPSINLVGLIFPTATVVNSSQNYDFTGAGILGGSLSKSGTGNLILENNNAYTGNTTINGGTLLVGNGGTTGSVGTGPVTDNSALLFNRTDSVTVTNSISGTGTLNYAGSGNLFLSGSNSYAGVTTISSTGTLHPETTNALGAGTAGLVNTAGGKLYVDVNVDFPAEPLTLAGASALEKGGSGISTLGGAVTLTADTTFSVDGGATLNLTNAAGVNGAAANANFTLAGTGAGNISGPTALGTGNITVTGGTWTVGPSNNFSGLTTINAGTLLASGPLSFGKPPVSFNASEVSLNGGAFGAASNVTLADGTIGITLNANAGIVANTNLTFVISNDIAGNASIVLTKSGPGTVKLEGPNDFSGTLDTDSGSTSANDGMLVIANSASIANILAVPGIPFINIRNNNGGSSTLALDGTLGSVTVPQDIGLSGRNVAVQSIENLAGNNTISGNITLVVGGTFYQFQSDSGTLTLSAPLPYATPTSSGRNFTFQGNGSIAMTGVIQDGSNNGSSNVWDSVVKTGSGILNLSAANTYSGPTVVSNGVLNLTGSIATGGATVAGGLLVGTGSIAGPVNTTGTGGLEAGATNVIGTLNLANTLTLGGNTVVKINKQASVNDLFSGQTAVIYGGTLTVTNLAGSLNLGDHFTLFNPGASASNFSSIAGSAGNGLGYSFTNGVLTVVALASNPTNLLFSVSGGNLNISWPADHLGWILQSQTNALSTGLSTNWTDVAGTQGGTSASFGINAASPAVFYRLRHP